MPNLWLNSVVQADPMAISKLTLLFRQCRCPPLTQLSCSGRTDAHLCLNSVVQVEPIGCLQMNFVVQATPVPTSVWTMLFRQNWIQPLTELCCSIRHDDKNLRVQNLLFKPNVCLLQNSGRKFHLWRNFVSVPNSERCMLCRHYWRQTCEQPTSSQFQPLLNASHLTESKGLL